MITVYVVDTSYLLELFAIPDFSEPRAVAAVRRRYAGAVKSEARLFVPLPCLFELANHIADVPQGELRHRLAGSLTQQVEAAIDDVGEWILAPSPEAEAFRKVWIRFAQEFAKQGIGLTDACIIEEARRLKRDRYRGSMCSVHIWTRDERLKAYEPDPDADPFVR